MKPGCQDELHELVAQRLAAGKIVAWFQGRMEFGPRALGSRSILADPRRPDMRDRINSLVKKGQLTLKMTGTVLNCPIIKVISGGM